MESELELFGNLLGKQIVNKDKVRIENVFDNDSDIIKWWDDNKIRFPILYDFSLTYLCIPGTSTDSERAQ